MTRRLYFEDPYCRGFTAHVIDRLVCDGRPAVVLDRTAFYPTGGGQPNDLGTLGSAAVIDVVEREEDSAVLHVLSAPVEPDEVAGEIDWKRRFDMMQQHTGQHVVSQAFLRAAGCRTVGFHLTGEMLTIDLNNRDIAPDVADAAEDLANQVVFEDRAVVARFVAGSELDKLPLRKPPKVETNIRVVEVSEFDWSPCGGTHVARTGELGLIKILKLERRSDSMRVEFRCGRRALLDYRGKNRVLNQLAADLSVGYSEAGQAIA
ncbi:MAG: alanyl-tRNA editing protein, partial [Acidobacteriota bacterium]